MVNAESINSGRISQLIVQLNKTRVIAARQWLNEKLNEKLSLIKPFFKKRTKKETEQL